MNGCGAAPAGTDVSVVSSILRASWRGRGAACPGGAAARGSPGALRAGEGARAGCAEAICAERRPNFSSISERRRSMIVARPSPSAPRSGWREASSSASRRTPSSPSSRWYLASSASRCASVRPIGPALRRTIDFSSMRLRDSSEETSALMRGLAPMRGARERDGTRRVAAAAAAAPATALRKSSTAMA